MIPGLSNMNKDEIKEDIAAMQNDPNFMMASVTGMAESAWLMAMFPDNYENMVEEMVEWKEPLPF